MYRLRPCLHDVKLTIDTIECPFDIHRALVVLLYGNRLPGQFFHLLVSDTEQVSLRRIYIHRLNRFVTPLCIDHLDHLGADIAAQYRRASRHERWLVHIEFIRVYRALHHHFTQSKAGSDEDGITETTFGIQGEHHATGADIRTHHFLHTGRKRHLRVIKSLVYPVGNGPVIEQ